ncbi:hypothetical protein KR067_007593 [Drosophila pandora]|nr:hypothetical protein KR067_007593 [Drosophila pandora]
MATTTTQSAAVAAPPALSILPTSRTTHRSHSHSSESQSSSSRSSTSSSTTTNNNNNSTTNTVISQPIKIPLSERFSSQTSTGSADSGVIVSSASQQQLQQLQQLQLPPPRSSSGSLSLPQAPPGGKWRQKQLLLSQDSGIENGVATSKSGQANTSGGSSKAEKGGGCSSESLESGGAVAENPPRIRAASALELSTSASASSSSSSGTNILRSRIKYKSTNSTGTQGFDVEDRIDEVDICDDDEDEDDVVDVDDEEDDGVNVDDVEEADNQSDSQSGIIINLKSQEQPEDQSQPDGAGDKSAGGLPPPDQAELTVAAALARRRDAKSLATDGHIYFPLLKISEDPHIDAKLINRKDGLQDTMYYLDEFGSPKLREKFARKQKQLLAKQQKQLLKRERRSEEQRKKRNTTVASNLAASGGVDTKDEHQPPHCDSSTARSKHNSVPPIRIQEDDLVVDAELAEDEDEMADGHVKMRRHSHDNHYDSQQSSRRTIAQVNTTTTRPANPDQDQDPDQDIEQGAEPALLEDSESPDHSKTSQNKLARTQSCVSWTKVVQKFKNILGMKQLIGKLNDLWPEHSVALSIPKEVDRSKEKLEGAWETTGCRDGSKITTVVATPGQGTDRVQEVSYTDTKVIGNGSFGVVFQAKLCDTGELVAIKKVLQDRRFKNRELQIMRKLEHCNIVKLLYFFYSSGEKRDEVFLNLVLEYIPETVYKVARQYAKTKQTIPINFIRLYMYQLFRSLAYIHSLGICHRDIKPQNLLLDPETAVLKLCDFGSAKQLLHGEPNVSYICSRYYRAPELIFGAINYTTKIGKYFITLYLLKTLLKYYFFLDVWSAGCVLAELLLGQPIFPGDSGVDQLVEVIKVLGTPTREQIREMNPNYTEFKFPQIKSHPWQKVFRIRTPTEAINLVSLLLEYTPSARITPLKACAHPFFDELRMEGNHTLPNGREMPPLFNFTEHELSIQPSLVPQLLPKHLQNAAGGAAANRSSAGASAGAASGSTSVSSTGSGASAEGSAQPQQATASATAAAAASASGAAAGSGSGSSGAGTAAGVASGGAAGTSGSGSGGNNSSSGGGGGGGGVGAPSAGNAQQSAGSGGGGGGGGGAAAAAATGATASGAIAATNAGGANVTGSQSNSALNNSTGNGNGSGNGNGNGGGSTGSGNGEAADESAGAAAETPAAAAAENEAAASG